jgi:anti-sigma B factor antagonist
MDFTIEIDSDHKAPIIRIQGEIDIYTCPQLNKTLSEVIEDGNNNFILNLENIQYIDSTGLGTIAHSARTVNKNSGTVHIVCNKPQILKIFEISGLNKKNIELHEQETNALKEIN